MNAKFNKLEENNKNKNIQEMYKGINELKKGYKPYAYDESTIVADRISILCRWEQFYSNLLTINQSSSLEGSEIYTVEPDIPQPSLLEVERSIKKDKLPESNISRPN